MTNRRHLAILGAGPAGLAAGFYATRQGIPFTIYEASERIGGNAITFRHGDFFFDSGAHRFHDKNRAVTDDMRRLLGDDLRRIDAPSRIFTDGRYVDFPLAVPNLARHLGAAGTARAAVDLVAARIRGRPRDASLESLAVHAYGRSIASRFLLNYSEKLWGLDASRLAESAAGARLKALGIRSLVTTVLRAGKARHFEGAFLYPRHGIGQIAERLGGVCGDANISRQAPVTGLRHDGRRIVAAEIAGSRWVSVGAVVSTLPVDLMVRMLQPAVPPDVLAAAARVRYRNLVLVALALDRPSVTPCATVYFPGREFPFTRVSEPRNRSAEMAPPGKTSLLVELPCDGTDGMWTARESAVFDAVVGALAGIGWIGRADVIDAHLARVSHAYPIAELGLDEDLGPIWRHLGQFENLRIVGRNAQFRYTWIHDLIAAGRDAIDGLRAR